MGKLTSRLVLLFSALLLLVIPAILGAVSADTEPNDSFARAEEVGDGIYPGSVFVPGVDVEDYDCYVVKVPSGWDLVVTLECTGPSDTSWVSIIHYSSFNMKETDDDAIQMEMNQGESETKKWYNVDLDNQNVYLRVAGDGDYILTIKTVESISPWVGIGICISIVIITVVVIIFIIVIVIRKKKKKEAEKTGPAVRYRPPYPAYQQSQYQRKPGDQYPQSPPYRQPPQPPPPIRSHQQRTTEPQRQAGYPPYGKSQYQYQYQTPTKTQTQIQSQTLPGYQQKRTEVPKTKSKPAVHPKPTVKKAQKKADTQFREEELDEAPPPMRLDYVEEEK